MRATRDSHMSLEFHKLLMNQLGVRQMMGVLHWLWRGSACVVVIWLGTGVQATAGEQPSGDAVDLSAQVPTDPLAKMVDEAVNISIRRYLSANVHTPWQIMHGLLALRKDYLIKEQGKKVSAIEWLSSGVTYHGTPWFEKTQHGGRAHPFSVPYAFEGHPNQFLAILAMSGLPMDHEIKAGDQTITIADIVQHAKAEVTSSREVAWTLWAFSHYLGSEARWKNKYGESWSIERLVRKQINEPVSRAACGGTHGLFALTYARNVSLQTRKPLRGVWLEADHKIKRYIETARSNQNRDGTFSTSYFQGRGYSHSFETRLSSSGHTLEFLMLALPQSRLREQWARNGVAAVARDLIDHRREPAKCAPLYHAVDALVIYRDRTNPKPKASQDHEVATKETAADSHDATDTRNPGTN